jgi:hypothetical protein
MRRYSVAHCLYCGRIWILDKNLIQTNARAVQNCIPSEKNLSAGELMLADGFVARVAGIREKKDD